MFNWLKRTKTKLLTKSDARKLIEELNLPSVISEFFKDVSEVKSISLNQFYRCPNEFYSMTKENQLLCKMDTIVPLLCDHDFYKVYAYDKETKGFLTYNIESFSEEIKTGFSKFHWEGIWVSEILHWWECEIPNNTILEMGKLLQLKNIEKILWSIENELDKVQPRNTYLWEAEIIRKYNLKK